MNLIFEPGVCRGSVTAPPSKSLSHRWLLAAALAEGKSVIRNLSDAEDIVATLSCLSSLGVEWKKERDTVTVQGKGLSGLCPQSVLSCHESGSTLRFLLPTALLLKKEVFFAGEASLFSRPLTVYEELCKERGFLFEKKPTALKVCGGLSGEVYRIPGDVSSQFVSGLLFALPLCKGDSRLEVLPPFESRPYVDLTLQVLKEAGVEISEPSFGIFEIPGGQTYLPVDVTVEGDCSNAAFFEALNFFPENRVSVLGLSKTSLQGDAVFPELFAKLSFPNAEIDLADCPDLAPILMALAAAGQGGRFTSTHRLSLKESNRGAAMAEELGRFGICVRVEKNAIQVLPGVLHAPAEPIQSHHDHRIAMALSVLLSHTGGVLADAECVKKSFPDFYHRLKSLTTPN